MFTIHEDGLIAGDVYSTPPGRDAAGPSPSEPRSRLAMSDDESWWFEHVALLKHWAQSRYGVGLSRREALDLMGVGSDRANTIERGGVVYMIGTPAGAPMGEPGDPLSYRFGLVEPTTSAEHPRV